MCFIKAGIVSSGFHLSCLLQHGPTITPHPVPTPTPRPHPPPAAPHCMNRWLDEWVSGFQIAWESSLTQSWQFPSHSWRCDSSVVMQGQYFLSWVVILTRTDPDWDVLHLHWSQIRARGQTRLLSIRQWSCPTTTVWHAELVTYQSAAWCSPSHHPVTCSMVHLLDVCPADWSHHCRPQRCPPAWFQQTWQTTTAAWHGLLDWSDLPCTAAWCCLVTRMTDSCVITTAILDRWLEDRDLSQQISLLTACKGNTNNSVSCFWLRGKTKHQK